MIFGSWVPQDNTARALSDAEDLFSDEGELLRVEPQNDGSYTLTRTDLESSSLGASRRVEQLWRVVAERAWQPDENELQFNVPEIIRGRGTPQDHGSGVLIVSSEDRILLQWNEIPARGLLSDSYSTEYQRFVASDPVRRPLAYRFQSGGDLPAWSGSIELLPQAVTLRENVQIELFPSRVSVSQDFQLQIANVPLTNPQIAIRTSTDVVNVSLLAGRLNSTSLSAPLFRSRQFSLW